MRRNRATSMRLLAAATAMGGVALIAGCEGTNLFSATEPSSSGSTTADATPPTVAVQGLPTAKPVGDSVLVKAHLTDGVGVSSVRMFGIAKRGSKDLGTDTVVPRFEEKSITFRAGLTDTTVTRYLVPTTDSTKEDVFIVVEASDSTGNLGADTVKMVVGGPDVSVSDIEDGQSVNSNFAFEVVAKDPQGISRISVAITGALEKTLTQDFNGSPDSASYRDEVSLDGVPAGSIQFVATARNALGVEGQSPTLNLVVVTGELRDTIAPSLQFSVTSGERLELTDSMQLDVTGADNSQGSGVVQVGYTVRAISVNRGDTVTHKDSVRYASPKSGNVRTTFKFAPFNVDSLNLPDPLNFQVTVYMKDASDNCGASVGADSLVSLACTTLGDGAVITQDQTPTNLSRSVVAGTTVVLPNGGLIMDAVVDTTTGRRNLYLSNIQENQVEVFSLTQNQFLSPIGVGSEPWGMTLNNCAPLSPSPGCGDTLIVGNSGGTNLSMVSLADQREDTHRRLLTPDDYLFDLEVKVSDTGELKYTPAVYPDLPDQLVFSDRPEFVARDSTGRVVYSTKVVEALKQVGTIRRAEVRAGYDHPEVRILVEHAKGDLSANFWRIAHIDAIDGGTTDQVSFKDHLAGTSTTFWETGSTPEEARDKLLADGSDIYFEAGFKWNIQNVGFSDTTYVSAAGDGGYVVIGDGNVSPVGRVIMYDAAQDTVSGSVGIADLMSNAGEQVEGIGLNYDGTLGVVRGIGQVSFFTSDLRLQGSPTLSIQGGSGAVLHPLHADALSLTNANGEYRPDTHLAFVGTSEHTVDIYDTFRFRRIGRVFIRDNISGPLKAAMPFAADNLDAQGNVICTPTLSVTDQTGRQIGKAFEIFDGGDFLKPWPPDGGGTTGVPDKCVVVKLYAVTDAGGVVVINVRKSDVLRDYPNRPE